jgi:hypothetical protein
MLEAGEAKAAGRADGYLGTEHLLEALIDDLDGVGGQILQRLGVVAAARAELEHFWSSPSQGSLLMVDCDPDITGRAYQVATIAARPGPPTRLNLADDGRPQVIADDGLRPAPEQVAQAALKWQDQHEEPLP